MELNQQADGTTTIDGSLTNISIGDGNDLAEGFSLEFTINEYGDITDGCVNVGDEITTDLNDDEGKIANTATDAVLANDDTYSWQQTGFNVPLKDIVGNSVNVTNSGCQYGCCVLGKAEPAAVDPELQTSDPAVVPD